MTALMTAPKPDPNARPAAVPPIPDGNGNGVLDGDDIWDKLKAEHAIIMHSLQNPETFADNIKKLPAYHVMRSIDAAQLAESLHNAIQKDGVCSNETLTKIAETIKLRLNGHLVTHGEVDSMEVHTKIRKAAETAALGVATEKNLSAEDTQNHLYKTLFEIDFAHSLRRAFPHNIAIAEEKVPGILGFFSGVPGAFAACRSSDESQQSR